MDAQRSSLREIFGERDRESARFNDGEERTLEPTINDHLLGHARSRGYSER
jgi:hypothetical protein